MAGFYSARSSIMPPLPWPTFAPPLSLDPKSAIDAIVPITQRDGGALADDSDPVLQDNLVGSVIPDENIPTVRKGGRLTGHEISMDDFNARWANRHIPDLFEDQEPEPAATATVASTGQQPIEAQTTAIPQQFQGSQQLMNAQDGIMPALNEGVPASRDQIAQALALGQQTARSTSINPAIIRALGNPYLNPGQRTIAELLLKQQMEAMDPSRQLDMEYRRAQIEAMRNRRQDLINAGDGRLYDPQSRQWIIAPQENGGNGAFRFSGNSVEAQALNGLMDSGHLTPEQAQQLGAGKTITGPNGEIIFLTPQGVFGTSQDGKTQQLSGGEPNGFGGTTEGAGANPAAGGNFQITEPKVTSDEKKAMGFADRMTTSGALIDGNESAGLGTWDQFVRGNDWIPDAAENWMVSEDFQKFDQARRDFINAQLRRESGAVISDEEFDNANKQYFPQPGDTKDVLAQKAANRKVVIDAMKRDAGPTYRGIGGDPLSDARKAIAAGADRNAVIQRLRENGIDPGGL